MKRIDLIYETLKKMYNGKGMSAIEIAEYLNLNRANVSNDLNKLADDGKVIKISGRPVLFMPSDKNLNSLKENIMDIFIKDNPSLYTAAEQAKAAILYPPKGMHILILGETGVGKSMFAELIHQYAIEVKQMDKKSPFVTFNCADYSNNPQLLISQLFGVKKGAYTGADSDKVGLIEKANGGILFLDEVHRLPPEGQEMFFTFMDKGIFRRLGETEIERTSKVIIISATTERPESTLLATFTRRIPMVIRIPSLSQRTMEERFHLISSFFREESFRLDREINVSINSLRAFLSYNCPNNIGQLKTDIQLTCAKAYADFVSGKKECIRINSTDLSEYVKDGLYKEIEHRQLFNKFLGINSRYCIFSKLERNMLISRKQNHEESIYDIIDRRIDMLKDRGIYGQELQEKIEKDIEDYFTKYINSENTNIDIANLESIISEDVIKIVQDIVNYAEQMLEKKLSPKTYYSMAVHISSSIDRIKKGKKIINPKLNSIRKDYTKEFNVALECLKIIENALDIIMPIDEAGFLAMFFVFDEKDIKVKKDFINIIVIAHGTYTATSMAEVANKLLGINNVIGINAPLEEKPQAILNNLKKYIIEHNIKSDILFLVDMGSLTTFGEEIKKDFGIKSKTIPLVSTLHVVEAARKAMLGYSLDEVYNDTMSVKDYAEYEQLNSRTYFDNSEKLIIITACTTGEGSALVLKKFLEEHLKYDKNVLEIIPLNLIKNEDIYEKIKKIQRDNKIICIVSGFNFQSKIPQFKIDEVLSLKEINAIQQMIDTEITYMKMGDVLESQLKSIDGKEAFKDIKKVIKNIEDETDEKINTDILIGVSLHIGCMIDRIKSGKAQIRFNNKNQFIKRNKKLYHSVKKSCSIIEEKYKIFISEDEICHIMRFFNYNA
ncbi:MAG: sigma 54-interacting transcriptional regulator [Caloramator sp.]|nr:sigma 54-interacting transcriptional regulator [Caloramator sp.]